MRPSLDKSENRVNGFAWAKEEKMVYYIRFLKSPRTHQQKGSLSISALICITTDLGDSFLAQDVDLVIILAIENPQKVLLQKSLKWKAGKRELAISLGPLPASLAQSKLVLAVRACDTRRSQPLSSDPLYTAPLVVSGWSAPFGLQHPAEKLVERRFGIEDGPDLRIWEEMGNSIARHIWDAALASVTCLQQTAASSAGGIPSLRPLLLCQRSTPLQVVELGAGCGIVGIALASSLSDCSVLLTDLPDVKEIVTRNINVARPAARSTIDYRPLDWDEPLPEDLCSGPIDLILVSDCTYNADSLPALVSVLDRLVRSSPDAKVVVALKRRHDSEAVFFDLMGSAGFSALHRNVSLPSQHDQVDQIEVYFYGRD